MFLKQLMVLSFALCVQQAHGAALESQATAGRIAARLLLEGVTTVKADGVPLAVYLLSTPYVIFRSIESNSYVLADVDFDGHCLVDSSASPFLHDLWALTAEEPVVIADSTRWIVGALALIGNVERADLGLECRLVAQNENALVLGSTRGDFANGVAVRGDAALALLVGGRWTSASLIATRPLFDVDLTALEGCPWPAAVTHLVVSRYLAMFVGSDRILCVLSVSGSRACTFVPDAEFVDRANSLASEPRRVWYEGVRSDWSTDQINDFLKRVASSDQALDWALLRLCDH
jgi:hypothetical protein